MHDASLSGGKSVSGLPETEEQADATKLLFFYLYHRLKQRDYVVERFRKEVRCSAQALQHFVDNYSKTKMGSDKTAPMAALARRIVFEYAQRQAFPTYLNQVVREAFGQSTTEIFALGDVGAMIRSAIDYNSTDLEHVCSLYEGAYTGYRFSTKSSREDVRHYVRYYLEIFPYRPGMEVATFSLYYRDRRRTRAGGDGFTTVSGFILPKSHRLYFSAAEARGRDNLVYMVCPYDPSHTQSEWVRGLVVTQNRDNSMIAARALFRKAMQSKEEEQRAIGVFEVDNTDEDTLRILQEVENHTDDYILTWYD
jgi:hypothetical protein